MFRFLLLVVMSFLATDAAAQGAIPILSAVQGRTGPRRAAPWLLLALFCEHVKRFDSTVIVRFLRTSNDADGH